jgi:hypothetical protein
MKVKELARQDGNEEYFVRYLSRYRMRKLVDLLQLANKLKLITIEASLPEQIYSIIKELNQTFLLQQRGVILVARQYAISEYSKQLASLVPVTPEEVNAYIAAEKEREVQDYLLEVDKENQERRALGIPEEEADRREIQKILKKVVVSADLIEEVRSGRGRVRKIGAAREGVLLAKSYIEDYIQELSERKEEEVKQELENKKFKEWPAEALRLVNTERERILNTYITDEDNASALNVFVTVMNMVKTMTKLGDRYLGKR